MPHVLPVGGGDSDRPDFGICPPGLHQAVCVDFVDAGSRPDKFNPGKMKHECYLVWQVAPYDDDGKPILNGAGERFRTRKYFTYSLHEKSNLYKALVGWRGRSFNADEKSFDIESVVGANCQLQIVEAAKADGSPVAKILSILPSAKGTPMAPVEKLLPLDYEREQDRDKFTAPEDQVPEGF